MAKSERYGTCGGNVCKGRIHAVGECPFCKEDRDEFTSALGRLDGSDGEALRFSNCGIAERRR